MYESTTPLDGDSSDASGIFSSVVALQTEGCRPLDIADALRRTGCVSAGSLVMALKAAGFSGLEVAEALRHFQSGCEHECTEDISTLPVFPAHRPQLDAEIKDVRALAKASWSAVQSANAPLQFFTHGGIPVWVKVSSHDQAVVEPLTKERMYFLLGEVGSWGWTDSKNIRHPCLPPKHAADHLLADPHPPLPRLRRLVRTPVFDARGNLVARSGYHTESGLFLASRGLHVLPVAHFPTKKDVAKALGLITHELLGDFDFVDDADLTNAVALGLLPFVRELISGPTPLHVITKPFPGSGGTLLVQVLLAAVLGEAAPTQGLPTDEAEIQRRITASLVSNPGVVFFDNLKGVLASGQLCGALTALSWEDRRIRTSTLVSLPITNVWALSGNNVQTNDEIARRSVPIRLDPPTDRPWERTGWRHQLPKWALEHRDELVWANLTLVQAWIAEGMPNGSVTMGMYEDWAAVLSGITEVIGLPNLQGNWREWQEGRPSEMNTKRKVVAAWISEFPDKWQKAKELLPVVGPLLDIDPEGGHSALTALGSRLRRWQGEVVDGHQFLSKEVSGSTSWMLARRF